MNIWETNKKEELWALAMGSFEKAAKTASESSKSLTQLSETIKKGLEKTMKVYYVKFNGSDTLYAYYCAPNVNLQVNGVYSIVADGVTSYRNNITVVKISDRAPTGISPRTITSAKQVGDIPRPDDRIKQIIFNHAKNTTVVLWKDGQKTIVKCQPGDEFDEEKALALCYMKRVLGNRGSFNEVLKQYCNQWGEEK